MRLGPVLPAALILLADTLPQAVGPDSTESATSRFRIALGYGVSRYEDKSFSCEGTLLDSRPVDWSSGGGMIEWRRGNARVSGMLGTIHEVQGPGDYRGLYGGVTAAGEWGGFGIGVGVAALSGVENVVWPSFYLRAGPLDGVHGRLELLPATENLGSTGWFRLGLGYRRGLEPGVGWALGLSLGPYSYLDEEFAPRAFGELDVPVTRGSPVYLLFRGQIGPGTERTNWSGSVGLRFDLGLGSGAP